MADRELHPPDAAAGVPAREAAADRPSAPAAPAAGEGTDPATVAALRARVGELEDQWRRAAADLDNLRKRVARDTERGRLAERARVAAEWLPVLDNLDLALRHATADPDVLMEGVRAVRDQALGVLARLGFPRQDDVGAAFDPGRHEAVHAVVDRDVPTGTVVEVVRPGYGDEEHQLRPAAVVVARPD